MSAYEGDTVASALYSSGTSIFSRSFKYHRARGLLCVAGKCPNCLVSVDGVPNVRACTEPVREGMRVSHQNAWPSLDRDALSVLDRLHWLMPVGFYYKALHRPKLLWKIAQRVIRRIGGLGRIDINSTSRTHYRHRRLFTDVAVVGGGPAGMAAALAAAENGSRVVIIDDQPDLGGHLRVDTQVHSDIPGFPDMPGCEIAKLLAGSVLGSSNIQVLSDATVFGLYQDNLLGVLQDNRLIKLRAARVVMATGSYESPMVFDNNDIPGVMLASAAQRLIRLYSVRPGNDAVVATINDQGYSAAQDLLQAGVDVVAVVDLRPVGTASPDAATPITDRGVELLASHSVVRAEGKKQLKAVVVQPIKDGQPAGPARRLQCDLLCMSGGFQPADALLRQASAPSKFDEALGESVPLRIPTGTYIAGEVSGIHDPAISIMQGRLAGTEAGRAASGARESGSNNNHEEPRGQLDSLIADYRAKVSPSPMPGPAGPGQNQFVCFCEDVTAQDIADAVGEGYDDIQILKRYSTVTMGPCQGKMCAKALVALSSRGTGQSIDETGATTSRPPLKPVPLAALAGPAHMPVKRTPMDRRHRELGAPMVELGPWQRAYHYGDPQSECLAVRQRVGIIDVSTLGKLEVTGKDAPALLDKVYTHRFSDLRVGRIRYGLLCSDNSTILDDGTVTRLADDRYFVTTTTGNVDLIEEWFNWWMAGSGMCAHVTNVTSSFAAVNVAGPRARDTLSKLTDIDLTDSAFRYMRSASGDVAGVPALLLRIGFVGETGWELHFPSEYGEYMWDTLLEAGAEYGIAPFGLEAQRILRLEKKHIIVGQDTDAVSNPLESDMEWTVRFDKADFIGRGGLVGVTERGLRNKLVGFVMQDGRVPDDGDPVVVGSNPIGRVTSARLSPTIGKGFGLAWVPVEMAQEGSQIEIFIDGKSWPAEVTLQPIYDPDGARLRGGS